MPQESRTTVAARLGSAFDKARIMPDQRSGVIQEIVEPQRDFDPYVTLFSIYTRDSSACANARAH